MLSVHRDPTQLATRAGTMSLCDLEGPRWPQTQRCNGNDQARESLRDLRPRTEEFEGRKPHLSHLVTNKAALLVNIFKPLQAATKGFVCCLLTQRGDKVRKSQLACCNPRGSEAKSGR